MGLIRSLRAVRLCQVGSWLIRYSVLNINRYAVILVCHSELERGKVSKLRPYVLSLGRRENRWGFLSAQRA